MTEFVDTRFGRFFPWDLKEVKEGYETARKTNAESFHALGGQEIAMGFARHLIEFLEGEGLVAAEKPAEIAEAEKAEAPLQGRPIEELHALIYERIKTITGAMIVPNGGFILLSIDGKAVGTIAWDDLVTDIAEFQSATIQ